MKELFYVLLTAFILFGFFRRFIYFQAYQSFTKAAEDFHKQRTQAQEKTKPVRSKQQDRLKDVGEYVDYEEVK
ncbi:MAG: hypothetical protein ACKO1U_05130 [Bacteroidota bacterium]